MFKKIWSKEILTRILILENDDANLASKKTQIQLIFVWPFSCSLFPAEGLIFTKDLIPSFYISTSTFSTVFIIGN